jgi:hypothetical protein
VTLKGNFILTCTLNLQKQWSLVDTDHLRYHLLNRFDQDIMHLEGKYKFLNDWHQTVTRVDEENKVRK